MLPFMLAVYAVYVGIALIQMKRVGTRRFAWAWLALFCIGLALHAMIALGIDVPGPSEPIQALISGLVALK